MATIIWEKQTKDAIQFGRAGTYEIKIIPKEDGTFLARLTPTVAFKVALSVHKTSDQARQWAISQLRNK